MINKYMHGHHFRSFERSRWQDRIQHTRDLLGGCLCKGWKRGPRAGRQSLQTLIQSWYQRKARERGRTGRKSLRPLCHPERIWTMLWGVLEPTYPLEEPLLGGNVYAASGAPTGREQPRGLCGFSVNMVTDPKGQLGSHSLCPQQIWAVQSWLSPCTCSTLYAAASSAIYSFPRF